MRRRALFMAMAVLLAGCGGDQEIAIRQRTTELSFRITSDPMPPHALEKVQYKVAIRDRKSGEPVESGEGIIYAESRDGKKTWDSFVQGPEVGTYYAKLNFLTAGDWAMGIQFHRDSTKPLQQVDWMQTVGTERR